MEKIKFLGWDITPRKQMWEQISVLVFESGSKDTQIANLRTEIALLRQSLGRAEVERINWMRKYADIEVDHKIDTAKNKKAKNENTAKQG